MLLLSHIFIALSSLLVSSYLWINPSGRAINVSYVLVAATLASGTLLVVSTKSSLLHTCLMGLLFTAVSIYSIAVNKKRLMKEEAVPLDKFNQS